LQKQKDYTCETNTAKELIGIATLKDPLTFKRHGKRVDTKRSQGTKIKASRASAFRQDKVEPSLATLVSPHAGVFNWLFISDS